MFSEIFWEFCFSEIMLLVQKTCRITKIFLAKLFNKFYISSSQNSISNLPLKIPYEWQGRGIGGWGGGGGGGGVES